MSEIKTRIENATAELATATQTIHDLPDYPDLENVYGDVDIAVVAENMPNTVESIYTVQEEDEFIIYSVGSNIYKYDKTAKTHTLIYTVASTPYVHYYNNKLYYNEQKQSSYGLIRYYGNILHCVDLDTKTVSDIGYWFGITNGKYELKRIIHNDGPIFWYAICDVNNSINIGYWNVSTEVQTNLYQATGSTMANSSVFFGDNYFYVYDSYYSTFKLYRYTCDFENKTLNVVEILTNYRPSELSGYTDIVPLMINSTENKIVLKHYANSKYTYYTYSFDSTIGNKLAEATTTINYNISNYTKYNVASGTNLYKFNESTNQLELMNSSVSLPTTTVYSYFAIDSVNHRLLKIEPNQESIVGFTYNGKSYSASYNTGAVSDKVLTGIEGIRDYNGQIVTGTMPNNGALSYTPTTSQQTIPAGYTSGGTIDAVEMTNTEYETCLGLTEEILGTESEDLPYTELEYIQGTGTQYIDTGITANIPSVDCKFNSTTNELGMNWNSAFGSRYGAANQFVFFSEYKYTSQYGYAFANYSDYIQQVNIQGVDVIVSYNKDEVEVTTPTDTYTYALSGDAVTNEYPIYIFCENYSGSPENKKQTMKLYYFKLYSNGVLVRDFIPVRRKSDNEVCLYDKVSDTFFTNAGTGTFVAGGEV